MMERIWINYAKGFEEAEAFDTEYYLKQTASDRLETMQFLRESFLKFGKGVNEGREGLRRFVKIIKQT
ncbi:MAG: hypothetical protein V2A53_05220 [bacterium]